MTEPAIYVNDTEIIQRIGCGRTNGWKAIAKMRLHPKFPPKDIGGKRYWPAVRSFLDMWNNLSIDAPGVSAGQEQDYGSTTEDIGYARARLAEAKERVGRRLARAAGLEREGLQAEHAADHAAHEHAN